MNNPLARSSFHIVTHGALLITLCAVIPLNHCHGAKPEVFFEPGLFSIEVPPGDYQWKKLQTVQTDETVTHYFTCTKDDSKNLLVLLVDERQANTDAQRKAIIKAHYKALEGVVVRSGFKLDPGRPKIKTPIGERIVYGVSGTKEDGSKLYVAGMIYFKHRIYMIQSSARSPQEVKQLISVGNTFQELYDPDATGPLSSRLGP
jgi:hypothetical protein